MANKDHSLDQRIIDAARAEFLEHGFRKASLHKIADRAELTTGALYTRYKNKDTLFCSLVAPALREIGEHMGPVEGLYRKAQEERSAEALLEAIRTEERIYLDLLYQHYEACVLLFCKSGGTSLEAGMNRLMEEKTRQTVEFFRSIAVREIDFDGIELLMSEQFCYYRQLLLRGYDKEKAVSCMSTVELFLEAGWKSLFDRLL